MSSPSSAGRPGHTPIAAPHLPANRNDIPPAHLGHPTTQGHCRKMLRPTDVAVTNGNAATPISQPSIYPFNFEFAIFPLFVPQSNHSRAACTSDPFQLWIDCQRRVTMSLVVLTEYKGYLISQRAGSSFRTCRLQRLVFSLKPPPCATAANVHCIGNTSVVPNCHTRSHRCAQELSRRYQNAIKCSDRRNRSTR
jgi:hypothetical protein